MDIIYRGMGRSFRIGIPTPSASRSVLSTRTSSWLWLILSVKSNKIREMDPSFKTKEIMAFTIITTFYQHNRSPNGRRTTQKIILLHSRSVTRDPRTESFLIMASWDSKAGRDSKERDGHVLEEKVRRLYTVFGLSGDSGEWFTLLI